MMRQWLEILVLVLALLSQVAAIMYPENWTGD